MVNLKEYISAILGTIWLRITFVFGTLLRSVLQDCLGHKYNLAFLLFLLTLILEQPAAHSSITAGILKCISLSNNRPIDGH